MKNKQLKEITERLELLTEREREVLMGELDAMIEKKNKNQISPREKLFREVENVIYGIGDISINSDFGVHIGTGANLIYNEAEDENVSLCYMLENGTMELHENNEVVLTITKDSPILEAFQELFRQVELDRKDK